MTKRMHVTRRNLFLQLLGILGTGLFAKKALALTGWRQIEGPGEFTFERVIATNRVHSAYVIQTVETTWYCEGWQYVRLDRALSTHGEALGNVPILIGDTKDAEFLAVTKGLRQLQPRSGGPGKVCSIGFCPGDGKWYGWSHRAIYGFGGGDKIFDGHFPGATDNTPFVKHGDITIKTWEQAKLAASRFAESVS